MVGWGFSVRHFPVGRDIGWLPPRVVRHPASLRPQIKHEHALGSIDLGYEVSSGWSVGRE
jgi:hypothetical protein